MTGPGGPFRCACSIRGQSAASARGRDLSSRGLCIRQYRRPCRLAAEICRQLDLPVMSVEYPLAPEHPWPAAPDDGEAATRWVAANGKALAREVTGLVLSGDRAGGHI
ncbi:MAG: lipase [Novosphingobium lindaniclasticum]|uniref:alpha/beta hydrolase fold domain-containing protein n=1 Tax=Novosphingobium lindaniclasticum TaxID=1329895 RepID=UPI0024094017|nr:alpha/beta hydrolase fold domain-containing protein [Novosphingobium lindaniclasticum]MDF2638905.1 lipase [Novosphingobium lindaniclasticum]